MVEDSLHMYGDTLKEICSTSSGNAASKLSKIFNKKVLVKVSRAYMTASYQDVAKFFQNEKAMIISEGSFVWKEKRETGKIFLFMDGDSAKTVISLLLNKEIKLSEIGEVEESLITELGNIVTSALINSIANFLEGTISVSPQKVTVDTPNAAVNSALAEQMSAMGCYLFAETKISVSDTYFSTNLFLFPYFDLVKEVWKKMNL